MAKKIQLNIAEPCHENWEAMSPDAKGKFCGSCQKQVVDFSNMSDRQIAEFFKKPSTGSVCGRFMTDQLDRPIDIPKKRIPWFRYFFQIALPAFVVSLKATANKTQGQVRIKTEQADTTRNPDRYIKMGMVSKPKEKPQKDTVVVPAKDPELFIKGEIDVVRPQKDAIKDPVCNEPLMGAVAVFDPVNKKEIEGIVINSKGEYVPYATIEISKSGKRVMTDENGNFSIKRNNLGKEAELTISSVSYENKKMIVSRDYYGKLVIQLKENITLPEVTLTALALGSIRREYIAGGVSVNTVMTQTVIVKEENTAKSNGLLVYPNPATAGASVNISLKDPEEGYYQLQFLNQSGQLVRQQEVWIDAEAKLMNTELPMMVAGTYVMVLTNRKTGKKYSEKIIIQ